MKSASGLSAVMEMEGASVGSEQVLDADVQSDNQRVYYEDESGGDDKTLPSFEESVEKLSSLSIAKWGDSIDDEGVLAGIQCKFFVPVYY